MTKTNEIETVKPIGAVVVNVLAGVQSGMVNTETVIPCRRCGKTGQQAGKAYHQECWELQRTENEARAKATALVEDTERAIPPVYRRFSPRQPVQFADGKPFVVIVGECGTGKTVTATDLLRRTAHDKRIVPVWANAAEMLLEIRATFDERNKEREADVVEKYAAAPLLCLDDLAAEKVSDYSTSTLYIILNRRGEYGLPTIVTSNLSLAEISARLCDRIANRLARYGNVVTLTKNNVAPVEANQ